MKRVLYPSNWLFNAGVIGLLRLLKEMGMDVNKLFKDNYVEDIYGEKLRIDRLANTG